MLRQLAEAMSGLGANKAVDYALRAAAAATAQLGFEEDARHCEAALELADDRRGEIARTARGQSREQTWMGPVTSGGRTSPPCRVDANAVARKPRSVLTCGQHRIDPLGHRIRVHRDRILAECADTA
jgi:hypothetical protein